MWDTPFDESMLTAQPGVAIYCPEKHHADELFEILRQNGIGKRWSGSIQGEKVYCVSGCSLKYGNKSSVESTYPYSDYIKCTFYGIESPDFDVASDDELQALLGIGGV